MNEESAIIVSALKAYVAAELQPIHDELARLAEILGHQVGAVHHVTERLTSFEKTIAAVSGEIHDTHETVKSVRAEQITLQGILDAAALMSEIKEREAARVRDTERAPGSDGE